jgi:hypothetical protein
MMTMTTTSYSINAFYALYWDIVMDWGMMQNPTVVVANAAGCATVPTGRSSNNHTTTTNEFSCRHGLLRPRLRFGFTMSLLILLADSVLRFSWLLRFVPAFFPSPDALILCTQFLEVVRRAIWNLLRIEWENIKQKAKQLKARDDYLKPMERPSSKTMERPAAAALPLPPPPTTSSKAPHNKAGKVAIA